MLYLAFPALTNATNAGTSLESSTQLLSDRVNLIASTTIPGAAYGITSALYCMTIYYLLKKLFRSYTPCGSQPHSLLRSKREWRMTLFYIVYTSVLFVFVSLFTAGTSQNTIIAFVDNRLYPQGPYQYYLAYMAGQPVMVMVDISSTLILWLTDGLILCRFIVFYHRIPYVRWFIPLPCAMYVGVIIFSALLLRSEAGLGRIFVLSENLLLAYYVLSFTLNILTTVLITARLYWHKLQLERIFGRRAGSPYMSIATVLIESAALYGAWSVAFLVLYFLRSLGQSLILATMAHIQVIASLLIIIWTARGKAWNTVRIYGGDEDGGEVADHPSAQPCAGGGVGIVSVGIGIGMKLGRLVGKGARPPAAGMGVDVAIGASRNASWGTVVAADEGAKHVDGDPDAIELELSVLKMPKLARDGAEV